MPGEIVHGGLFDRGVSSVPRPFETVRGANREKVAIVRALRALEFSSDIERRGAGEKADADRVVVHAQDDARAESGESAELQPLPDRVRRRAGCAGCAHSIPPGLNAVSEKRKAIRANLRAQRTFALAQLGQRCNFPGAPPFRF